MPLSKLEDSRILIVDDREENIRLLERVLAHGGYHAYLSTTEPRAVLSLAAEFRPDLILLDLNMPHMDGFEVLRQLNPVPSHGCAVPVLMLTGEVDAETKRKALMLGAEDFLGKPICVQEVLLRTRRLLQRRFELESCESLP